MENSRILIVEDEAIIAMEIESQLQGLGYEVNSIVDTGECYAARPMAEIERFCFIFIGTAVSIIIISYLPKSSVSIQFSNDSSSLI